MELRGERECTDCGVRWSYFDTGAITCPECGSPDTVSVDDSAALHTDSPVELELDEVRARVEALSLADLAAETVDVAREYVRERGFVRGGELLPLDDTYLAARELVGVADAVGRAMTVTEDEEWYLLELLRVADRGERPPAEDVPAELTAVHGLACANAVRAYRRDVRDWLATAEDPPAPERARSVMQSLDQHVTRVRALQGDVPVETAEALVAATRDVGRFLRAEDPNGLDSARTRLEGLDVAP